MLRLTTFGGLALSRDGVALTGAAAQRSRLALLAILASAGPTGISRDKLLVLLWPENDDESARHALKQAIYALRRDLGDQDAIQGTATLCLNPALIESDLREFETALDRRDYAVAVAAYGGPFLDGVFVKDSPEFDRWASEMRARLAHDWADAVESLATAAESSGAWRDAIGLRRQLAAAEPMSGRNAVSLMRALAESGDVGGALQHFKIHESMVREELDAAPDSEVVALAESMRSGKWVKSPPPSPQTAAPDRPKSLPEAAGQGEGGGRSPVIEAGARRTTPPARTRVGPARRTLRRARVLAIAASVLLLVLVTTALVVFQKVPPRMRGTVWKIWRSDALAATKGRFVVPHFRNDTGRDSLGYIGRNIASEISTALRTAEFDVVFSALLDDLERLGEVKAPLKNGFEQTATQAGAEFGVRGHYEMVGGDSIAFSATIVDIGRGRAVRSIERVEGRFADIRSLKMKVAAAVTAAAAIIQPHPGAEILSYTSNASQEAIATADELIHYYFANTEKPDSAIARIDRFLAHDSSSSAIVILRAYILDVRQRWPELAEMLPRIARFNRLTKFESALVSMFKADLDGNLYDRLRWSREAARNSGGLPHGSLLTVFSALYAGHPGEAIDTIRNMPSNQGLVLVTASFWTWYQIAEHYGGTLDGERMAVEEGLKSPFPDKPGMVESRIRYHAARGDLDALDKALAKVPPNEEYSRAVRVGLLYTAASELLTHKHAAPAAELFKRARQLADSLPDDAGGNLMWKAETRYATQDWAGAAPLYQRLVASGSRDPLVVARLGGIAAHTGDSAGVTRAFAALAALNDPYLMGGATFGRAHIEAVLGHTSKAVDLIRQSFREGHRLLDANPNTVHVDIDFVKVRDEPAYKEWLTLLKKDVI